nr:MAG TPA: hypothetical protein [Caudoviricetes sp.]
MFSVKIKCELCFFFKTKYTRVSNPLILKGFEGL